jgi:hypothetical protein
MKFFKVNYKLKEYGIEKTGHHYAYAANEKTAENYVEVFLRSIYKNTTGYETTSCKALSVKEEATLNKNNVVDGKTFNKWLKNQPAAKTVTRIPAKQTVKPVPAIPKKNEEEKIEEFGNFSTDEKELIQNLK